jgi:hypothetical protein
MPLFSIPVAAPAAAHGKGGENQLYPHNHVEKQA